MSTAEPITPEVVDEATGEVVEEPTTRAVVGAAADIQTSGQLPALARMSDDDFEMALEGMKRTRARLRRIHREVMEKDVDYGQIPGTDKDTLYKSGAEILLKMNGCVPKFERQRITGDGESAPHILWDSTCFAVDRDDVVQAEGAGSCNSWEKKYRYRSAERLCPQCGSAAIIKGSAKYGGGFICWRKKNGCGAKFDDDDKLITEQQTGQVDNPDPYDLDNTIKKMADKRAMVAAALALQAASGSFAQDVEDKDEGGESVESKDEPAAKGKGEAKKIDKGKQGILRAKATRRANALGLEAQDAGSTVLSEVLRAHSFEKVEDVTLDKLNDMIAGVEGYDLPTDGGGGEK
jgi:hypothetical protein